MDKMRKIQSLSLKERGGWGGKEGEGDGRGGGGEGERFFNRAKSKRSVLQGLIKDSTIPQPQTARKSCWKG